VIVVDTSVWIDAHRRPNDSIARTLAGLLDADEVALALPVRLELVAGISKRDRPALTRALSGLPLLRPTDDTWTRLDAWVPAAADKGRRFSMADWLIAALTSEIAGLVWSLDEDFADMEQLQLVARYAPPLEPGFKG
jgi:predicted nucleic acid-binding protein